MGFKRAGFQILGGIEQDPHAVETYAKNLFKEHPVDLISKHARAQDIEEYLPKDFFRDYIQPLNSSQVDLIIGGPPCQAFSRIGRAKLRDLMSHDKAYLKDKRAVLYHHFLNYVDEFKPKAILMENVPEIVNYGGVNIAEEISATLIDLGYEPGYSILNAAHFGVPQTRVRFFLMAFRSDLEVIPSFPRATHAYPTRNNMYFYPMNGKRENGQLPFDLAFPHYLIPTKENNKLKPAVNCRQAIGDLPSISTDEIHEKDANVKARRNFGGQRYSRGRPSHYAQIMRYWPNYQSKGEVTAHAFRYLPRDHETFRRMQHGDQYPEAHSVAKKIYDEKVENSDQDLEKVWENTVPPYPVDKFPNKWQKLDPDEPSHTITAHLGKDTYSHIHYDSEQARVISVREAARLQSFPDGFEFPPALSHSFRQIGNAVPPLLAYKLASHIKSQLRNQS